MAENGVDDSVWPEERDCVPLKLRSPFDVKIEDQQCDLQKGNAMKVTIPTCLALEEGNVKLLREGSRDGDDLDTFVFSYFVFLVFYFHSGQFFSTLAWLINDEKYAGLFAELSSLATKKNAHVYSNEIEVKEIADTVIEEKVDSPFSTLPSCIMLSKCSGIEKVKYEDKLRYPVEIGIKCSLVSVGQVVKKGTEIGDDFLEDLDHIVLKKRRSLLLSRKVLQLTKPVSKGKYSSLSNRAGCDVIHDNHGTNKEETYSGHLETSSGQHHIRDVPVRNSHNFCDLSKSASSTGGNTTVHGESNKICLSKKASAIGQDFVCGTPDNSISPVLSEISSTVKAEPMEYDRVLGLDKGVCTFVSNDFKPVKSEFPKDSYGDDVDNMLLSHRIKLLASKEISKFSRVFESSNKTIPSYLDCSPVASECAPSLRINRPRKRRRTITDSIEIAMEEDSPGLLKVLIDKGVSVNEIKLYGVDENDEAPDDSLEESFSELEAVISKLFFQRQSFLKLGTMRCMKGEKPSYCLACLVSLVEQARYLKFRKWPIEWGWCRDLQSFIFVFQRHHRIVLERPEYGYATYFFELVDSLTINWQIKRLVTAMKLTSCGRITLIENRSLLVGEDLSEREARVLMEFGWTPSSGLGTMLNYRDRVNHDRKNESDSSEWRSKIGKLLMDGYNGGTFVSPDAPGNVVESGGAETLQVKLEI